MHNGFVFSCNGLKFGKGKQHVMFISKGKPSAITISALALLLVYGLHVFAFNNLLLSKTRNGFLTSKETRSHHKKSGSGIEFMRLEVKHNIEKRSGSDVFFADFSKQPAIFQTNCIGSAISTKALYKCGVRSSSCYKRYCSLGVFLI